MMLSTRGVQVPPPTPGFPRSQTWEPAVCALLVTLTGQMSAGLSLPCRAGRSGRAERSDGLGVRRSGEHVDHGHSIQAQPGGGQQACIAGEGTGVTADQQEQFRLASHEDLHAALAQAFAGRIGDHDRCPYRLPVLDR